MATFVLFPRDNRLLVNFREMADKILNDAQAMACTFLVRYSSLCLESVQWVLDNDNQKPAIALHQII